MWYACSIAVDTDFDELRIEGQFELAGGIRIEQVPAWVKSEDALSLLSWTDRERILEAQYAFSAVYEAEAIGSPDPNWSGIQQRSIQAIIDEKFALAALAVWIARPSRLTAGPVFHFDRSGDPTSLRQTGALHPLLVRPSEADNVPTAEDLRLAGELLKAMLSLDRKGAVWLAVSTLFPALREVVWQIRYLLQWIALEALFGPESASETTHRLAQRIGLFVGADREEKLFLFREAKKAYAWRSKIVHGLRLDKLKGEKSLDLSTLTEQLLRRSLMKILTDDESLRRLEGSDRDRFLEEIAFN